MGRQSRRFHAIPRSLCDRLDKGLSDGAVRNGAFRGDHDREPRSKSVAGNKLMSEALDADFEIVNQVAEWQRHRNSSWAWDNFRANIYQLMRSRPGRAVLEIGGGRFPMFDDKEIAAAQVQYIVNDISEKELSKAPSHFGKLCFDIASPESKSIDENAGRLGIRWFSNTSGMRSRLIKISIHYLSLEAFA